MDIILILILILLPLSVSILISVNINKYGKSDTKKSILGFEVARTILDENELENVYITESNEAIMSYYDFRRKVVRLKKEVFNNSNLKSCVISAKEASRAIMDKKKHQLYSIRNSLSTFLNILLYSGYTIIALGTLFGHIRTIYVGFAFVYSVLLFHICTIKIERDTNKLALIEIKNTKLFSTKEIEKIKKILDSLTYIGIASITYPIIELVKRIIQFGDSNK